MSKHCRKALFINTFQKGHEPLTLCKHLVCRWILKRQESVEKDVSSPFVSKENYASHHVTEGTVLLVRPQAPWDVPHQVASWPLA